MSTPHVTAGPEAAPLLVSAMRTLRGNLEASVYFIKHYCMIETITHLDDIADNYLDGGDGVILARKEWSDLQDIFDKNASWPNQLALPPIEAIWAEAGAFQLATSGTQIYGPARIEETDYHGMPLNQSAMSVFEFLRSIPDLLSWMDDIISAQPRYTDPPGNVREQKAAREVLGANTLPDLARAIESSISASNPIAGLDEFITFFAILVYSATNYALSVGDEATHMTLDNALQPMLMAHRSEVTSVFSNLEVWQRQKLATFNIRGTFSLLLMDTVELTMPGADECPVEELHWHMFKKFVDGIILVANTHGSRCVENVNIVLEHLRLDMFLDSTVAPIPHWVFYIFDETNLSDDDDDDSVLSVGSDDSSDDFNFDDLPDVCFEPAGPAIQVERHAIAVTMRCDLTGDDCSICRDSLVTSPTMRGQVPVKTDCGHCFHYDCLTTLINGISKFSNLCPNCRYQICTPRERRLKSDEQLDGVRGESAAETTAGEDGLDEDLQDGQGDVVMTDR